MSYTQYSLVPSPASSSSHPPPPRQLHQNDPYYSQPAHSAYGAGCASALAYSSTQGQAPAQEEGFYGYRGQYSNPHQSPPPPSHTHPAPHPTPVPCPYPNTSPYQLNPGQDPNIRSHTRPGYSVPAPIYAPPGPEGPSAQPYGGYQGLPAPTVTPTQQGAYLHHAHWRPPNPAASLPGAPAAPVPFDPSRPPPGYPTKGAPSVPNGASPHYNHPPRTYGPPQQYAHVPGSGAAAAPYQYAHGHQAPTISNPSPVARAQPGSCGSVPPIHYHSHTYAALSAAQGAPHSSPLPLSPPFPNIGPPRAPVPEDTRRDGNEDDRLWDTRKDPYRSDSRNFDREQRRLRSDSRDVDREREMDRGMDRDRDVRDSYSREWEEYERAERLRDRDHRERYDRIGGSGVDRGVYYDRASYGHDGDRDRRYEARRHASGSSIAYDTYRQGDRQGSGHGPPPSSSPSGSSRVREDRPSPRPEAQRGFSTAPSSSVPPPHYPASISAGALVTSPSKDFAASSPSTRDDHVYQGQLHTRAGESLHSAEGTAASVAPSAAPHLESPNRMDDKHVELRARIISSLKENGSTETENQSLVRGRDPSEEKRGAHEAFGADDPPGSGVASQWDGSSATAPEPKKLKLQLSDGVTKAIKTDGQGLAAQAAQLAAFDLEEGEDSGDRRQRVLQDANKLLSSASGTLPLPTRDSSRTDQSQPPALVTGYLEKDGRLERARKVPPISGSKKVASNISKWTTRQGELHAAIDHQTAAELSMKDAKSEPPVSADSAIRVPLGASDAPVDSSVISIRPNDDSVCEQEGTQDLFIPDRDYDFTLLEPLIACMLCNRAFKKPETLERHLKESVLHKTELEKEESRRDGYARKQEKIALFSKETGLSKGFIPLGSSNGDTSIINNGVGGDGQPKYRDRASERRAVFGADTPSDAKDASKKTFEGPAAPASEPSRDLAKEGIDTESNKGAHILSLMGWKKDQGLGAEGEGRVAPVETMLYNDRAGLGSTKPKDATDAASLAGKSWQEVLSDRAREILK